MNSRAALLLGLCLSGLTSIACAEAEAVFTISGGEVDIDKDGLGGTDTAFKVGSGFKVTENVGVEIYWAKYGKPEKTVNIGALGDKETTTELYALVFEFVSYIPMTKSIDLLGRGGMAFWKSDVNISGSSNLSDDGISLSVGVGAQTTLLEDWALRVEWEYGQYRNFDVSFISVGFAHFFE